MSLDYLSRPSRRQMRVIGEQGTLEWDGINQAVTLTMVGEAAQVSRLPQARDEMYLAQDMAFIESSWGTPDPRLATGEEGARALAICDAARRASELRREVEVDYL
jgi:predicted dehydrogenase